MEKFVLVMAFAHQVHAYGPFPSEANCLKMMHLANEAAGYAHVELIEVCHPMGYFRRSFPQLAIEEPAT